MTKAVAVAARGAGVNDWWTAARRERFLIALVETADLHKAAAEVGANVHSACALRACDADFAAAWQMAQDHALAALEWRLLERALNGDRRPYFHGGEKRGEYIDYPDRLAVALLTKRSAGDARGFDASVRLAELKAARASAERKIRRMLALYEKRQRGDDV